MILLACVLVNYTLTRLMYRKSTDGRGIRQKRLLLLALGYDLGVLFSSSSTVVWHPDFRLESVFTRFRLWRT